MPNEGAAPQFAYCPIRQKAKEERNFKACEEGGSAVLSAKKQKSGGIFVPNEGAAPQFAKRK